MITPHEQWAGAIRLSAGVDDSEFARRVAVSRIYYATYHLARGVAPARPAGPGEGGVHRALIEALQGSSDPEHRLAGRRLDRLRHLRVEADYHLSATVARHTLDEAVRAAGAIRKLLGLAAG